VWNDKFVSLKQAYEERLNELGQRFKVICFNISSDEVINAMRSDPSTVEFIKDRMAEIVSESMRDEKERTISMLNDEIANYRGEIRALKNSLENMNEKFLRQDEETNKARLTHESALKNWENSWKMLD